MPGFRPTQPTEPYIIKGIPIEAGENPGIRLELRDLKKDPYLWNLYLVGLWQFQEVPKEDQLSYFQIAGIHGLPYESWPVGDKKIDDLNPKKGGKLTRDTDNQSLTLIQKILTEAVTFVADQFTKEEKDQAEYVTAAKKFRMPYWDWAHPKFERFPIEATDDEWVDVTIPNKLLQHYPKLQKKDGTVKIKNPLFSFHFPEGTNNTLKIHNLDQTTRYHLAVDPKNSTPKIQGERIDVALHNYIRKGRPGSQTPEANLRERLVYLLKSYDVFDQVSHNSFIERPDSKKHGPMVDRLAFGSIEDVHNAVHGMIGGKLSDGSRDGHMSNIAKSAFDPIFWLHHTNIDRIVSIWEALHVDLSDPKTWVTSHEAGGQTWATSKGEVESIKTDLTPFYKNPAEFYNSNDVRYTKDFGYAYPETQFWKFVGDTEGYKKNIRKQLDALYQSGSLATLAVARRNGNMEAESLLRNRAVVHKLIDDAGAPSTALTAVAITQQSTSVEVPFKEALPDITLPQAISIPAEKSLANLVSGTSYLEWTVNIKALKHAMDGQYQVHVFLGRVPPEESPDLYHVSPYHVGTFIPLGQSRETACAKCKIDQADDLHITGQIPLTIALAERYFSDEVQGLEEDHVIPYLQEHLHWEVVGSNGQRLEGDRKAVDGLLVGVASNKVTLPQADGEWPTYSPNITLYPQITTKEDPSQGGRAEGTGITQDNLYFVQGT